MGGPRKPPDRELELIRCVPATATRLLLAVNGGKHIQVRARSPVPGGAELDDLGLVGPGLLFAAGMYLAAVGTLARQVVEDGKNRDWQAAPLLRSLYEYVVTFCWVTADDSGARARDWAAEDRRIRLAIDREFAAISGRSRLSEETRAAYAASVADAAKLKQVMERARQADEHWTPLIPQFQGHPMSTNPGPLTDKYALIYRGCSAIAHPTPLALQQCFVHPGSKEGEFIIGTNPDSSSRYFYTMAPMVFSYAILVGGMLYEWVDGSCLDEAFADWPREEPADNAGDHERAPIE